jgi:hypothetical protein
MAVSRSKVDGSGQCSANVRILRIVSRCSSRTGHSNAMGMYDGLSRSDAHIYNTDLFAKTTNSTISALDLWLSVCKPPGEVPGELPTIGRHNARRLSEADHPPRVVMLD